MEAALQVAEGEVGEPSAGGEPMPTLTLHAGPPSVRAGREVCC